jgi:hypothetical protein
LSTPAEVAVHVDLDAVPVRAGIAYFTQGRQRVTTSFAYDPAYRPVTCCSWSGSTVAQAVCASGTSVQ